MRQIETDRQTRARRKCKQSQLGVKRNKAKEMIDRQRGAETGQRDRERRRDEQEKEE